MTAGSDRYLYSARRDRDFDVWALDGGVRVGDQNILTWRYERQAWLFLSVRCLEHASEPGAGGFTPQTVRERCDSPLVYRFQRTPHYCPRCLVSDAFLNKVVVEPINRLGRSGGTRLMKITTRCAARTIRPLQISASSRGQFLWSEPFARALTGLKPICASVRPYFYARAKNRDLTSSLWIPAWRSQHVGVEASNNGRVVWAAPLGIYGKCIVVAAMGWKQSGHLSQINVHEGDMVKRGQGDGLEQHDGHGRWRSHSLCRCRLDNGQIDPEWWVGHWIKDIAKRVGPPGFSG